MRTLWLWLRSKRELAHTVNLQKQEIDSLRRQLTAAVDFIDAMSWESRLVGSRAKIATESHRQREGK